MSIQAVAAVLESDVGEVSGRKVRFWSMTDGRCAYCGASFASVSEMTIDHLIPRAIAKRLRGNLFPCCRSCNSTKGSRPLAYLRDALQRRKNGRPQFSSDQIAWLGRNGFVMPKEDRFQFYWEQCGNSFPEEADA